MKRQNGRRVFCAGVLFLFWGFVGGELPSGCRSNGDSTAGQVVSPGTDGVAGAAGSAEQRGAPGGAQGGALSFAGSSSTAESGSGGIASQGGVTGLGGAGGESTTAGTSGGGGRLSGSGGNAGTQNPPYSPCPVRGEPCKIMPLGDSITYGYNSSTLGGYRVELLHRSLQDKKAITFVGSQSTGPDRVDNMPFPKANEGHSGYTIDDAPQVGRMGIAPLVADALTKYKPHIVALMIGTNDIGTDNDLANAPARLGALIDAITKTRPDALVVVAQIVPTQDDALNKRIQAYNAAIPSLVKDRAGAGKHVLGVDMYGALTADANYKTDSMANTLHPNDKGFVVMGDTWYRAIGPFLP